MSTVIAQDLVRRYGKVRALDGFNLQAAPGTIVGLIGRNGAGKSTALRAMLGLIRVHGHLEVLGLEPFRHRATLMRRAAYIADVGTLPGWMKVRDALAYVAAVNPKFDIVRATTLLEDAGIAAHRKIGKLSKGMIVQTHLAIVLAIDADLLVLDEPTLGLDIVNRRHFYDRILNDYFDGQRTIVVSTHDVAELEHILTHVAFIADGRDVLSMPMEEVATEFALVTVPDDRLADARALEPIAERSGWQGHDLVFRGKPEAKLAPLGPVRTPTLPELFIACVASNETGATP